MNTLADSIDWVTKAGTLPMQGLLLLAIGVLGGVLRKLHKENQKSFDTLLAKIETKDLQMTQERLERIKMLMDLVRDDVSAKTVISMAVENNTKAIDANTATLRDLHALILELKLDRP